MRINPVRRKSAGQQKMQINLSPSKTVFVLVAVIFLTFAAATGHRVWRNKNDWSVNGFYGYPREFAAQDDDGRLVKIVLTESRLQPLPSEFSQWKFAAREVWEVFASRNRK